MLDNIKQEPVVVWGDDRSVVVEYPGGDGRKPLRQLLSKPLEFAQATPDAYLMMVDGNVAGVVTLDLLSFYGSEEAYESAHPGVTLAPAYIHC